jgi:Putative zinc-finger/Predicted integral membrane protein (DUF2275)
MDCGRVREKLGEYMDGAAGATQKRMIEEHLSLCRECSSALADLRKTVDRLGTLEDIEPPPWLPQRVMAQIRAEKKTSLLRRLFNSLVVKVPIRAAATVLIAVTTIYLVRTIQHDVIPQRTQPTPQEKTAIREKGKDSGTVQGRGQMPPATQKAAKKSPQRQRTPQKERAGEKVLPGRRYAPAAPASTGEAAPLKAEKAVGSFNEPAYGERGGAMRDARAAGKTRRTEAGRPAAAGVLQRDEEMRGGNIPGPVHTPRQESQRVLWTDKTITADDIAKVLKVTLVRETANALVFEVEYYVSDAFSGNATVGLYPDIPDRSGGKAQALPGKHSVSISVSRPPSAMTEDSKNLSIEIVRQEDAAPRRPLFRKIVPFVKRWGTDE